MEDNIFELISETLRIDGIQLRENRDNKDIWDSLQRIEILFALEDEFGIAFSEDELSDVTTPQRLIDITIRKVQ